MLFYRTADKIYTRIVASKYAPQDHSVLWIDVSDQDNAVIKHYILEEWRVLHTTEEKTEGIVRTTKQDLSEIEKKTARENIGAASQEDKEILTVEFRMEFGVDPYFVCTSTAEEIYNAYWSGKAIRGVFIIDQETASLFQNSRVRLAQGNLPLDLVFCQESSLGAYVEFNAHYENEVLVIKSIFTTPTEGDPWTLDWMYFGAVRDRTEIEENPFPPVDVVEQNNSNAVTSGAVHAAMAGALENLVTTNTDQSISGLKSFQRIKASELFNNAYSGLQLTSTYDAGAHGSIWLVANNRWDDAQTDRSRIWLYASEIVWEKPEWISDGPEVGYQYVMQHLTTKEYVDSLITGLYTKPNAGIPKSDLASTVRTSLGKADSAYQKPSGGIPATDLTSSIQTALSKANTALQSFTESDPIFMASAAKNITASNISNWNSKQAALVSGTNIKTVNGQSLLGSGDITITAEAVNALLLTGNQTAAGNKTFSNNIVVKGTLINGDDNCTVSGTQAHSEGTNTNASGNYAHAEGNYTVASGVSSHAEGTHATSSGVASHAEGSYTAANGNYSHAEGENTSTNGASSHSEGFYTTTSSMYEHASGWYNKSRITNDDVQLFSIGCGRPQQAQNLIEVRGVKQNVNGLQLRESYYVNNTPYPASRVYIKGIGGYDGTNSSSDTYGPDSPVKDVVTVINSLQNANCKVTFTLDPASIDPETYEREDASTEMQCDKTVAQITSAANSGAYVFAALQIPSSMADGLNIQQGTVFIPLVCIENNGTIVFSVKRYGSRWFTLTYSNNKWILTTPQN